jgi:hypothetical protein
MPDGPPGSKVLGLSARLHTRADATLAKLSVAAEFQEAQTSEQNGWAAHYLT